MSFAHVWAIDFEFREKDGSLPEPVCCCALDLLSGRQLRLWGSEMRICPFDTGPQSLFVAFYASAEIGCFLALDWSVPELILDLYPEFEIVVNGHRPVAGRGLLGAMAHYGLPHMSPQRKETMRNRVQAGPPYTDTDREEILDYCMEDVTETAALLIAMEPVIGATRTRFGQALLRGRFMAAAARIERVGIPIDTGLFTRIQTHWESLQRSLIDVVDDAYGVFEEGHWRTARFEAMVARRGYALAASGFRPSGSRQGNVPHDGWALPGARTAAAAQEHSELAETARPCGWT